MRKYTLLIIAFFAIISIAGAQEKMLYVRKNAQVVIGDTISIKVRDGYNLFVENGILTEKVKVALRATSEWSDDAFAHRPNIAEMEDHIHQKSHLLAMPSATKLVKEGYELKDMDSKLLRQIEWLWMEVIDTNKENASLKQSIKALEARIKSLEQKL